MQVGDSLPSLEVQEGAPGTTVNVRELFAGKKGVLFGVPGAFTPGCSKVRFAAWCMQLDTATPQCVNERGLLCCTW